MNPKIRRRARQGRSIAMMKQQSQPQNIPKSFKCGDTVVSMHQQDPDEVMIISAIYSGWIKCKFERNGEEFEYRNFLNSILRHANEHEKIAGHRAGSHGFDLHWYGQSEADAIREHLIWQDELIPHGAALVGKFSNIGDVMCQVFEDVVINGSAAAVVSEDGVTPVEPQVSAEHVNEAFRLNNLG